MQAQFVSDLNKLLNIKKLDVDLDKNLKAIADADLLDEAVKAHVDADLDRVDEILKATVDVDLDKIQGVLDRLLDHGVVGGSNLDELLDGAKEAIQAVLAGLVDGSNLDELLERVKEALQAALAEAQRIVEEVLARVKAAIEDAKIRLLQVDRDGSLSDDEKATLKDRIGAALKAVQERARAAVEAALARVQAMLERYREIQIEVQGRRSENRQMAS